MGVRRIRLGADTTDVKAHARPTCTPSPAKPTPLRISPAQKQSELADIVDEVALEAPMAFKPSPSPRGEIPSKVLERPAHGQLPGQGDKLHESIGGKTE